MKAGNLLFLGDSRGSDCPRRTRLLFLSIVLIVITPSLGLAGVHPGVEAGLNLSSLRYDDWSFYRDIWNPGWRTSFTEGAFLEIPLRRRLDLTTGLRYVQQGNRVKYDTGPGSNRLVGEFRR